MGERDFGQVLQGQSTGARMGTRYTYDRQDRSVEAGAHTGKHFGDEVNPPILGNNLQNDGLDCVSADMDDTMANTDNQHEHGQKPHPRSPTEIFDDDGRDPLEGHLGDGCDETPEGDDMRVESELSGRVGHCSKLCDESRVGNYTRGTSAGIPIIPAEKTRQQGRGNPSYVRKQGHSH